MYLPSMARASSSDHAARSGHWGAAAVVRSVLFNLGLWSWTAVMLLGALGCNLAWGSRFHRA